MRRGYKYLFIDFNILLPDVLKKGFKKLVINLNHIKIIRAALNFEQKVNIIITNAKLYEYVLPYFSKLEDIFFKLMTKLGDEYKTKLATLRADMLFFTFYDYKKYETPNYFYKVAFEDNLVSLNFSLVASMNPKINSMALYSGVNLFPKKDFDNGQLANFKVTTTRKNF